MMRSILATTLIAAASAAETEHGCVEDLLPYLEVPHCDDGQSTATINKRLGTLAVDFPEATVGLCYTDETLELVFKAYNETSYLVDDSYDNNDPLWEYTVMEAFIAADDHDPTEYLEFEVAPNNKIWTGFIHNPNKNFDPKATAFIDDWETYPITSDTEKDEAAQTWTSEVSLPLSMFNVEAAEGTSWRMNFFRTYFADENSEQEYGAWNPNKLISFHQTPCFGKIKFASRAADSSQPDAVGPHGCTPDSIPHLDVPHCSIGHSTATINKRLGTLEPDFPDATVRLCYTDATLELVFKAYEETSYLVNDTYANNDPLWQYTVMEAFIAADDHDPTEYLEFEVAPNNKIWTGFIHNPNKNFDPKATAFIDDWETYPINTVTSKDEAARTWTSDVSLPLSMFNVEEPVGTSWRMNFFRTYFADEDAEQEYGAWNPNKLISFHQTPCFGMVRLIGASGPSWGSPRGSKSAKHASKVAKASKEGKASKQGKASKKGKASKGGW